MILGAAIEFSYGSTEVVDDRQFAPRIADAGDSLHGAVADDRPFDVTSRAMDTNEVQRGECLASEEVDDTQIENELMRHADPLLNEVSECLAIRRVDVARDDHPHAFRRQVVDFEGGAAASQRFLGGRQL